MTTTTSPSALTVIGLRKSFGEKTVLDGIDFDIAWGSTYSLLGPNGAGKSTTVQILSTLLSPDAGEVRVAGFDLAREPDAVRAAIGHSAVLAIAWCAGITAVGYLWARRRYDRNPSR